MVATSELINLKTARNYKFIIGKLFFIHKSRTKWPLVLLILLHHAVQITGIVLLIIGSKGKYSITAPTTLARKIHWIIIPIGYIHLVLWWRQVDYLVEALQEVNEIFLYAQFPLLGSLRTTIITELESRHWSIILCLTSASQISVLLYFLPPVIALFFNPSPSRKLRLPMEMPDPLSLLGVTSNDVTTTLIYLSFCASYLVHFYIIYLGAALQITAVDSLRTAFCICGLSLGTLGHDKFSSWEQFVDAVKLHQRLFRLSARMKSAIEPILTWCITTTVAYNVLCGLAIAEDFHVQNTDMMFGVLLTYGFIAVCFILPGSTSIVVNDISKRIYLNEHWVARKLELAPLFSFMIMRSNKPMKFRVYNCLVLTSENLIQYTNLLHSFYVVLKAALSKYDKDTNL